MSPKAFNTLLLIQLQTTALQEKLSQQEQMRRQQQTEREEQESRLQQEVGPNHLAC